MKLLTEPQAWRKIAKWWAEGRYEGASRGLCWSVAYSDVSSAVYMKMRSRIIEHLPWNERQYEGYAWPCGCSRDERCLFALFMALIAEEE